MSNVPVLESVRAAFDFQRLHWRTVSGVLAAAAAGATVQTAGDISGDSKLAFVGQVAYLLAVCMGYAALMRIAEPAELLELLKPGRWQRFVPTPPPPGRAPDR